MHTNAIRIFILSILAVLVAAASADTGSSLTGVVQDPQNQAVPGAVVTLFSRNGGALSTTTSDASGTYRFDALAAADYLLRVEAPGFAAFRAEEVHLTQGAAAVQNVALDLAGVREQVVVTASGTSQTPGEVSKTITVITRAEAEQRDAFLLSDVVKLAPGVRVQQLGGPGQLASIRVRGLREIDTAVLVDGLRLREASALHSDASGLIQDLLFTNADRVEVMNGAGSSLYGTNAIGGVVNILTDQGGGRTRGSLLAEAGSLSTMRGRATVAGGLAHDRLQYSAGVAHINVLSGVDGDDPFRDTSAQGRVSYRISNATMVTARLFAADSFAKLNASPTQTTAVPASGIVPATAFSTYLPATDDSDNTRAGRFLSGAVTLDGQPSARLNYALSFQTLASSRRYGNGPAGAGFQPSGSTRSVYDGRVQTARAQLNYKVTGGNLLSGGYEFETETFAFDSFDRSNPTSAAGVNATQKSSALFVQDQASFLSGRLQLSGGFRAQYFRLDRPVLSPAASAPYQGISFTSPPAAYTGDGSAAYSFRETGTKLRAHLGRGYRAPSLYERFGSFSSLSGYSVYGDPRLAPEHSLAFDAGIDQDFGHGRARASVTYFYTRLEQVVAFGTLNGVDPFGRRSGYLNAQGGLSRGVELKGAVSPVRSLDVSAAYTFVNAVELAPLVGDVLRSFVIPRHQFSASAVWRAGKRTMLTFDTLDSGNYLEPLFGDFVKTFTTRVYRFDGMRQVNAGASYRVPLRDLSSARFYVRGENLGNQNYYEFGFRTPGRTVMGGVQLEF